MKWFRAFWQRYVSRRAPAPAVIKPAPYIVPLTPAPAPVVVAPAAVVPPPAPIMPVAAPLSLTGFAQVISPAGYAPRDILRAIAAGDANKYDATGWRGLVDSAGVLDISRGKRIWITTLAGLADANATLVDRGINAIKGVMSFQGADGSFPTQDGGDPRKNHSAHHKAITLEGCAAALLAVRNSPFYVGARMAVIDSLIAQIDFTARWLAGSDDLTKFFADTAGQTNQFMSMIGFLHTAGVMIGSASLQDAARTKLEWLFDNMVEDGGTFREQGDFDTVYQLVSMRLLAGYIMLLPPGLWRDNCLGRLRQGYQRWTQCIYPLTGMVDVSASTRTTVSLVLTPNKIDTWDSAGAAYSLYLGHYVAGPDGFAVPLDVIARRQLAAGQQFEHQE